MAKKRTTEQIKNSWPKWKQSGFDLCWSFDWRLGCGKKDAALAWDQWIDSEELSTTAVNAAKKYCTSAKGSSYLAGMAPWINQNRWENELPEPRREQAPVNETMCKKCGNPATIRYLRLCVRCYTDAHSTIHYMGQDRPFTEVLAITLADMGMAYREGESRDDWTDRCRLEFFRLAKSGLFESGRNMEVDR
jgi:hypothetical protein|tara:strand:- start:897 stop:1469 length:573 start_codon:yes stop_codon:yes gene_type:complete